MQNLLTETKLEILISLHSPFQNKQKEHTTMTCRDGIIGSSLTLIELSHISIEEQDQFEHSPDLLVAPVLTHDFGWIIFPIQESKLMNLEASASCTQWKDKSLSHLCSLA